MLDIFRTHVHVCIFELWCNVSLIMITFGTVQTQSMGVNHKLDPSLWDGDSLSMYCVTLVVYFEYIEDHNADVCHYDYPRITELLCLYVPLDQLSQYVCLLLRKIISCK